MRLDVIDLSHWQAHIPDFAKAKAAGLVGVILKATEGLNYVDPVFETRKKAVRAAGLSYASYHFLKAGGAAQISHYLYTARPVHGERVIIDYEDKGCQLADLHAAIERIHNVDASLQITVYGGSKLKEDLKGHPDTILATTSLWLAQYTTGLPAWPQQVWPTYSLWQYSDGQFGGAPRSMAGFTGTFDCNEFHGSHDACRAWFGPVGRTE
jgi:lysozyme